MLVFYPKRSFILSIFFFSSRNSLCVSFLLSYVGIYCAIFDTAGYGNVEVGACTWSGFITFPSATSR